MRTTKFAALAAGLTLTFALTFALAACGGGGASGGGGGGGGGGGQKTIGVAMPTKADQRWIMDGNNLKKQLQVLGYKVNLQYAENDIPTQTNQLDNMITQGASVLIIAAIDGTALTGQLEEAKAAKIPVISYDRLLMNSPDVDYYASFDNFKVGVAQANSLLTGLGLLDASGKATNKKGPLNIELFAGDPADNNAPFFFKGAMSILQPLINKGTLVVKSKQTTFETIAIPGWDPAKAQARMEDLLAKTYGGGVKVDGVLSPYDGLSIGILSALKSAGYGTAGQPYPIVTGQDAEVGSVKSIIRGEQYSTIFKDTRELAKVTVAMADAVLKGTKVKVNDTKSYNNGKRVVPSYLLPVQTVTKDNYKKVLIDSGYYTAAQLH